MEFLKLNPSLFLFFFIDGCTRLIFPLYFQGIRMKFFRERKFNIFSRILEDGDGRSVIYNVSSARGQFFSF